MDIDKNDLFKIQNILKDNWLFFRSRDQMNAKLHLAKEVRYSPLTNATGVALGRINAIIDKGHNSIKDF